MNRPFNEAKYKALLEGLEISEIYFRYVQKSNNIFRFDSTYFLKEYLLDEGLVLKKRNKSLKGLFESIRSFGAYSLNNQVNYQDAGIPFIRGINMKGGIIDFSNMIYISEVANKLLWKSEVKPNTVLLSMSGTLGDVAITSSKWDYPINSNQDIAKIVFRDLRMGRFVYAFLLSKFGQNYIKREARGSVQQHVFLSQIEDFIIPILSDSSIDTVSKLIDSFEQRYIESQQSYAQAENLLNKTLGLDNFEPSNEKVNIKSFKDSFLSSGRLDAEYYQKKYEGFRGLISNYKGKVSTVKENCILKDGNFMLEDKSSYKYIELSNIGKSGDITGCTQSLGEKLPSRAKRKVSFGDVLISSIEGSLKSCAMVTQEFDNSICSTGFYVINSNEINPETLLVLFKSEPIQKILKQKCSGTILTAINKDEFLTVPLPIVDLKTQQQISDKVTESFKLKKQSEALLELAKTAVELAIEEGEEKALRLIEKGLGSVMT